MTVYGHHDFAWQNPDGPQASPDEPPSPAEPIIVVEVRSRGFSGLLVPPAIILAIAAVLIAYRPQLATWFGPPPAPRGSAPALAARAGEPAAAPPPIVLEVKPLPTSPDEAEEPLELAVDGLVEPPIEPATDDAPAHADGMESTEADAALVGLVEPPADVEEPVVEDPEAVAARARDEILRESERIRAEQAEVAVLRARQAELDRVRAAEAEVARQRQAEEARLRAQKGRDAFRAELLEALRLHGDRAGPHILRIAEKYHVEPGAAIEHAIKDDLGELKARKLGRTQRVAILRANGLPEPLVLGDLIHLEERRPGAARAPVRRASGGGPAAVDYGAVVRATRQLLALPPDSPPIAGGQAALLPGQFGLIGQ